MNARAETSLIPRATIEEIVGYRNQAIALYGDAYNALAAADAAVKAAAEMARRAYPGINTYNHSHE